MKLTKFVSFFCIYKRDKTESNNIKFEPLRYKKEPKCEIFEDLIETLLSEPKYSDPSHRVFVINIAFELFKHNKIVLKTFPNVQSFKIKVLYLSIAISELKL